MRSLVTFFLLLTYSCIAFCQGVVTGVEVFIMENEGTLKVTQKIQLTVEETDDPLQIRMLEFDGTKVEVASIKAGTEEIVFEEKEANGIINLLLDIETLVDSELSISYSVSSEGSLFYLPFFFTSFSSSSSDDDFFTLELEHSDDENYFIHFPGVPHSYVSNDETNHRKTLKVELPALPSVFRLERAKDAGNPGSFVKWVDGGTGAILIIIGLLIWFNRKRFIDG